MMIFDDAFIWFVDSKNIFRKLYLSMISSKLLLESSSGEKGKYSIAERKILYLVRTLMKKESEIKTSVAKSGKSKWKS